MTLVGPRPEPPALVEALRSVGALLRAPRAGEAGADRLGPGALRLRRAAAPGTAWKMCHDLYYVKHRSAGFDLMMLAQTIHALVERDREEQMPAPDFILGDSPEASLVSHPAAELAGR